MKTERIDRKGNEIGNGDFHAYYEVLELEGVNSSVSLSETTESVYVTYYTESKSITVRFSNHVNNAVAFGDQLDGNLTNANEILFRLGLKTRTFIPATFLHIHTQMVKKVEIANYEMSELTIREMYDLGANADLSAHQGKIAKDSNYLILGDKVTEDIKTSRDVFGNSVKLGTYIYQ